jgi:hypothetical protein
MASPEYHRRQAQLFSSLAKVASDPDTAAELERLAAAHHDWARRGETIGNPGWQAAKKNQTGHNAA